MWDDGFVMMEEGTGSRWWFAESVTIRESADAASAQPWFGYLNKQKRQQAAVRTVQRDGGAR